MIVLVDLRAVGLMCRIVDGDVELSFVPLVWRFLLIYTELPSLLIGLHAVGRVEHGRVCQDS